MASSICSSAAWKANAACCSSAPQRSKVSRLVIPSRRRDVLLLSLFASFPLAPAAAGAAADVAEFEEEKFALTVPKDWLRGEGNSGVRKVVAFHPPTDTSANVNIIITNLGADFTSMGSFGSVDGFAANMVSSMDRSYKNPPGQAARLVDSMSKNGMYYVEYTLEVPGEAPRHILSAVGIGATKYIKQLYTVTGQYLEKDADKYKEALQKAIQSFRIRKIEQ